MRPRWNQGKIGEDIVSIEYPYRKNSIIADAQIYAIGK
jgi:hypothetical protein